MTTIDTLQLKFKEKSYTINFPNNGEYLRIQNMKPIISPSYDILRQVGTDGMYAEVITDMIAHFTILCPKLVSDLAKPISELSMSEGKELLSIYNDQFKPWFDKCLSIVFGANKEEVKEVKSNPVDTSGEQ